MSTYYNRLEIFARAKGYKTVNSFGINALKYSSSEKLNRLKKEGNKPSIDVLIDITNVFVDFNIHWYVTGKGEMLLNETKKEENKEVSLLGLNEKVKDLESRVNNFESEVLNLVKENVKEALKEIRN